MTLSSVAIRHAQRRRAASARDGVRGRGTIRITEAPHDGLNTRDTFDNLKDTEARLLENWFPEQGGLSVRKGYSAHATGVGSGAVKTLAELDNGAVRKFIAFSATEAFDITSAGAAASQKSGLTSSGRWDHDQMEGVIGFVDGVNTPQKYDGTTWSNLTLTNNPGLAIGIKVHKNRSYFWEDNKDSFWYSADKAMGGTLTEFRLGAVVGGFGKLLGMESWTVDGGAGPDDLAVFMGSTGKVVVYSGLNPGDSSWSIVGVYDFGAPLSRDSALKFGGDLVIQTAEDYVRLTAATLQAGQETRPKSKMSGELPRVANLYAANDGWGGALYPNGKMIVFNVPVSATRFDQHVMNTATGAWTIFRNIPARVWGMSNGSLYFGDGAGNVFKFWDTNADAGAGIAWEAQTSWNAMKSPLSKAFTMVRPIITAEGTISFGVGLAFDFGTTFTNTVVSSSSVGAAWDDAEWDVAEWAPEITPKKDWFGAAGDGVVASLRLRGTTLNQNVKWFRTDYFFTNGGVM